jgi:hypothetical protein
MVAPILCGDTTEKEEEDEVVCDFDTSSREEGS